MLPRSRFVASRISTLASITPSPSSRLLHTSLPASASTSHAPSPSTTSHSLPPASHSSSSSSSHHHDEEEANGWFGMERPGYKGDLLPGGGSRASCRFFAWSSIGLVVAYYTLSLFTPSVDPQLWAKEWVLSKEKFRVPDKANPFGERQL